MSNHVTPAVSRTQKSRIFEMVFRDKRELLGLYNAVNGTGYENPELLEINTLENAFIFPCTMTCPLSSIPG